MWRAAIISIRRCFSARVNAASWNLVEDRKTGSDVSRDVTCARETGWVVDDGNLSIDRREKSRLSDVGRLQSALCRPGHRADHWSDSLGFRSAGLWPRRTNQRRRLRPWTSGFHRAIYRRRDAGENRWRHAGKVWRGRRCSVETVAGETWGGTWSADHCQVSIHSFTEATGWGKLKNAFAVRIGYFFVSRWPVPRFCTTLYCSFQYIISKWLVSF